MLQILDWDNNYETRYSRRVDQCSIVSVPNRQNGLGFKRVLQHPRGLEIFSVFILLVELCSLQKRPRHGLLSKNGAINDDPWQNTDIARELNLPIDIINCSIEHLCSNHVQWLRLYTEEEVKQIRQMAQSGEKLESIFEVLRKCPSDGHFFRTLDGHFSKTSQNTEEYSLQVTDNEQHTNVLQKCPSENEKGKKGGTIGGNEGDESELILKLEEENKEHTLKQVYKKEKNNIHDISLKRSYELFVKYYNMLLDDQYKTPESTKALKATLRWSDQRARKWSARCNEPSFRDFNITILKKSFDSDWLMGRFTGRNKTYFILTLDWIIKNNTNYTRILDGYYDNRESKKQSLVEQSYDGDI